MKRCVCSYLYICLGEYISMDMSSLPMLWLAYLGDPSDSGRIHSNVRERWLKGKYTERPWPLVILG